MVAGYDDTNVQSLKTNTSGRLEQVLYDGSGNPVAVVLDNSIYRLETRSSIVGQTAGAGSEKKVTVIDDVTTASHKRMQVEADIKPGATINVVQGAGDPTLVVTGFLTTSGGSEDMVVDGSGTSVTFTFPADGYDDILITSLRFVFSAGTINIDGNSFAKGSSLTNGITIGGTVNGGAILSIATIQFNADWLRLQGRSFTEFSGADDLIVASVEFGGRTLLEGGSGDEMTVTIQDDLTTGARDINYLTCTFYGVVE